MQPNDILSYFAKYIHSELGIVFADHNYFQLQNRLEEISKLMGCKDLTELHALSQKGISGAFKQLLLDIATNNETSFFRDPKVFKAIEALVLTKASEGSSSLPLNIWSAASSTGQEALSVAMLILEFNQKHRKNIQFHITATDISERVLARAKAADYSQLEVQRGLPAQLMIKYFKKDVRDRWIASSDLTRHITFQKLNLKEKFIFSRTFDLVLCRNVLIYQNVASKIEIVNRLTQCLTPGGFLLLGSGENLMGLSQEYDQAAYEGAVLYKRKTELAKAA